MPKKRALQLDSITETRVLPSGHLEKQSWRLLTSSKEVGAMLVALAQGRAAAACGAAPFPPRASLCPPEPLGARGAAAARGLSGAGSGGCRAAGTAAEGEMPLF